MERMFSTFARCCRVKVNIQTVPVTKIIHRKYMKTSDKMEQALRRLDQAPRNAELIYRHTDYRLASLIYHCTNLIACLSFGVIGYNWYFGFSKKDYGTIKGIETKTEGSLVILVSIGMIILAATTRNRYAIRIYFNDKTQNYKAIFIGKLPYTSEFHEFPKASITYVSKDSILPWRKALFDANGRKIFLFDDAFRTPNDFLNMLAPQNL